MKLLVLLMLIASCTTTSTRREVDMEGQLPRAITLGAFAPSCFMFCSVQNNTTQGDVTKEDLHPGTISIESSQQSDFKMPAKKPDPKEKP